ncbi:MAG: chaperone modulator CbpM [Betaproteobacteria bacterium]
MNAHSTSLITDVLILEEQQDLSLDELCRACQSQVEQLMALVDEGVIAPQGAAPVQWRFSGVHLRRARVAIRLQRDLHVNTAGAALALQLMDEIEALRAQLERFGA